MAVHANDLPDHTGIGIETPRPEAMAEDDNRAGTRRFAVARAEEPPCRRQHAERLEVVRSHDTRKHALGAVGHSQADRLELEVIPVDGIEGRGPAAHVEIVRI
jgi:hypothetical protein